MLKVWQWIRFGRDHAKHWVTCTGNRSIQSWHPCLKTFLGHTSRVDLCENYWLMAEHCHCFQPSAPLTLQPGQRSWPPHSFPPFLQRDANSNVRRCRTNVLIRIAELTTGINLCRWHFVQGGHHIGNFPFREILLFISRTLLTPGFFCWLVKPLFLVSWKRAFIYGPSHCTNFIPTLC